ncbi:hypothetical protein [Streptacidiphilus rugosus]|uniref:hypothetical protein n=1 Tax=Streptacidiphilus rugosus TaxID=405783 RepID=UPI0012F95A89|nr:hypothetical protein [Streptacidiphilus rugosus]
MDFPANSRPGVIPAGRTAIGDADAANLLGLSLTMFRHRRLYGVLPPTLSRPGARIRLWDLDQVAAYLCGQAVPALPSVEDLLDLLDGNAARDALPENRRPANETWHAWLAAGHGPAPDQTFHINNLSTTPAPSKPYPGAPYRLRSTVLAWDARGSAPGGGEQAGTPAQTRHRAPRQDDQASPRVDLPGPRTSGGGGVGGPVIQQAADQDGQERMGGEPGAGAGKSV